MSIVAKSYQTVKPVREQGSESFNLSITAGASELYVFTIVIYTVYRNQDDFVYFTVVVVSVFKLDWKVLTGRTYTTYCIRRRLEGNQRPNVES